MATFFKIDFFRNKFFTIFFSNKTFFRVNNSLTKQTGELQEQTQCAEQTQIRLKKAESESKSRENQVKKLQDEMAALDETIARLTKDKRRYEELSVQSGEQLAIEEGKVLHLGKAKADVEQALDEAESQLERERRARAELEKVRRNPVCTLVNEEWSTNLGK